MKRINLTMLVMFLIVTFLMTGCQNKETAKANEAAKADETAQTNEVESGTTPHLFGDFVGSGAEFSGGNTVSDYNLSSVRRAANPDLVRLVFEFSKGDSGQAGAVSPKYKISMGQDPSTITMSFEGVTKADIMKNKKEILGLSNMIKDITFSSGKAGETLINLYMVKPVTFTVFDLGNPARLVVVMKPDQNYQNYGNL